MADGPVSNNNEKKLRNLVPFKPGEVANPKGRPKGSRNKLGEAFVSDVLDDWEEHGKQAIIDMRAKSPGDYVKVVAGILPKELNVKVSELDELTDDQLVRQLSAIASQLAAAGVGIGAGVGAPEAPQSPGDLPTIQ